MKTRRDLFALLTGGFVLLLGLRTLGSESGTLGDAVKYVPDESIDAKSEQKIADWQREAAVVGAPTTFDNDGWRHPYWAGKIKNGELSWMSRDLLTATGVPIFIAKDNIVELLKTVKEL